MKRPLYNGINRDIPINNLQDLARRMKQFVHKLSSILPLATPILGLQKPAESSQQPTAKTPDKAYLAYTQMVTALAAKLACIDGAANKAEFDAFSTLFAFSDIDAHLLKRVFIKHAQDIQDDYSQYARSLARMPLSFMQRQEVMRRLALLIACDGTPNPVELEALYQCNCLLGLDETSWRNMMMPHLGMHQKASPYQLLGISKRSDLQEVKNRYHQIARLVHPDQISALPLSAATRSLLQDYFCKLAAAYESLVKQRKL